MNRTRLKGLIALTIATTLISQTAYATVTNSDGDNLETQTNISDTNTNISSDVSLDENISEAPVESSETEVTASEEQVKEDVVEEVKEVIIKETTNAFHGFNRGRGGNELVAYTSEYGERTKTNDYGIELIVEGTPGNGKIVAIGGNNNIIPKNGYVLSGHGTAATYIKNEAFIGASISINEETNKVSIKVTTDSLLESTENEVNIANTCYENAKNLMLDVPLESAKESLDNAKVNLEKAIAINNDLVNGATTTDSEGLLNEFISLTDSIKSDTLTTQYRTMESRSVDGRGVWHRPVEHTLEDVQNTLQQLKDANVNMMYIETFYHGYVIFPTDNEIVTQRPEFVTADYGQYGNDVLKAFVEEGKKMGIEVHAWVQNFRFGYYNKGLDQHVNPILENKPEWSLENYDGTFLTKKEDNYYFADPAIKEVRDFLLDIYKDMVENYDIAGLQLDYIRYPVGEYKNDTGYGEVSTTLFKEAMGIPQELDIKELMDKEKHPETWKQVWDSWNKWKQDNVTNFVGDVDKELKAINPDILLSTAIFPNIEEAKDKKMQDWPEWVKRGYIDLTAPMAYYKDAQTVKEDVSDMVEFVGGNCLNYSGIAPSYLGLTPDANAFQVQASLEGQAQGAIIFASQFFLGDKYKDVREVLKESTNRESAVVPHDNMKLVMETLFNDILDKCENIYIPNGVMTKQQSNKLNSEFNKILAKINGKDSKSGDKYIKALSEVSSMISNLLENVSSYSSGAATDRITDDLNYLKTIVDTRSKMAN